MSASVAALHGLTVRGRAARTPRVRRITTRAVEEPKESTADEPKAVGGGLPPGIKTRPAPDVDPSITGDWRTGKIWRPPPGTPKFRVDLGKGTVEIVDEEEERRKYARMRAMNAAAAAGKAGIDDADANPASLVPERQIKLRDSGNVAIAAMTEEDCVDATKLIMALFFKVRPQDFLAKDRLQKEQSERVYQGLVDGVVNGKDRLLVAAKVGGKVVGVAEVSLPGGKRFGAEKLEPRGQVVFIGGSLKVQRRRLMVLSDVLEHPSGERTFARLLERHGRLDRAAARQGRVLSRGNALGCSWPRRAACAAARCAVRCAAKCNELANE